MDLSRLFERRRWDPKLFPYKSWRAELDALARGRKGMSIFGCTLKELERGGYDDVLTQSLRRNLVFAIANSELGARSACIYIARPDQLWRVPAHLALWATAVTTGPWSSSSEALEGLLLGYTPAERKRWLAARRERYAGERGANVYTLLTPAQKQGIVATGNRYLGDTSKLTVFAHVEQRNVDRRTAQRLLKGVTMGRFALDWAFYDRLFKSSSKRGVVTASIPSKLAPTFHAAVHSNVQFLTRRGWV
jgi:hypothetical protein